MRHKRDTCLATLSHRAYQSRVTDPGTQKHNLRFPLNDFGPSRAGNPGVDARTGQISNGSLPAPWK